MDPGNLKKKKVIKLNECLIYCLVLTFRIMFFFLKINSCCSCDPDTPLLNLGINGEPDKCITFEECIAIYNASPGQGIGKTVYSL